MSLIQNPILTIAIPTFNRAKILDLALNRLFPQVKKFEEEIELIISDNASQDNTQEIIKNNIKKYNIKNIITFRQKENTGYFGNFKRCRELSTGKYFWLLSDNEHVNRGLISFILSSIKINNDVSAFFLNREKVNGKGYIFYLSSFNELVEQEKAYLLTLISSVIFINDKTYDNYLFTKYNNNSFLGFLFLLSALRKNSRLGIIKGISMYSYPSKVTFNIFEAWTKDITECVDYMIEIGLVDNSMKNKFVTGYLKNVLYRHVLKYKAFGNLYGKTYGSSNSLEITLTKFYLNYPFYVSKIVPLLRSKRLYCLFLFLFNRIKRTIIFITK
jgi:glycosyltransferase involved in cell wall biosynthesis